MGRYAVFGRVAGPGGGWTRSARATSLVKATVPEGGRPELVEGQKP